MLIVDFEGVGSTEFLKKRETGLVFDEANGIICDPFLESSVKDIFVAGDSCSYPNWFGGQMTKEYSWHSAKL